MWLYLPKSITSQLAPEQPDSTLLYESFLASDCKLSVASSGTPTPRPPLWRGWKKRTWMSRLYGTISLRSMADRGRDLWTSSLAVSRASRSPWQVSKKDQTTTAGSGMTSLEWLVKLDVQSSTWKTSQRSLLFHETLEEFSETWPKAATLRNGCVFARPTFELRTAVPESTSWPTPRSGIVKQGNDSGSASRQRKGLNLGLQDASTLWATRVRSRAFRDLDSLDERFQRRRDTKVTEDLESQTMKWATPRVTTNGGIPTENTGKGSRLEDQAGNWPTPTAEDAQMSGARIRSGQTLHQVTRDWATPAASDCNRGGTMTEAMTGQSLTQEASAWSTPRSNERGQYQRDKGKKGEERPTLTGEAMEWATPHARDSKSGAASEETLEKNSRPLNEMACQFSRPVPDWVDMALSLTLPDSLSLDSLKLLEAAMRPSCETPSDGEKSSRSMRRLNPRFSEWLMNWPRGWTDSGLPAREWCRWLRQSRLRYLQIVSGLKYE